MIRLKSILLESDNLKKIIGVTKEDGDCKSFGSDAVINHSAFIDKYHHKIKDIIDDYYLSWRYNPNDQYLYWWETPNEKQKESVVYFLNTHYPKYKIIGHRFIHGFGDKKTANKMFYASHGFRRSGDTERMSENKRRMTIKQLMMEGVLEKFILPDPIILYKDFWK